MGQLSLFDAVFADGATLQPERDLFAISPREEDARLHAAIVERMQGEYIETPEGCTWAAGEFIKLTRAQAWPGTEEE